MLLFGSKVSSAKSRWATRSVPYGAARSGSGAGAGVGAGLGAGLGAGDGAGDGTGLGAGDGAGDGAGLGAGSGSGSPQLARTRLIASKTTKGISSSFFIFYLLTLILPANI
jgi:hypothetical protein